eukprot:TRINITY_DN11553_c0_g1_i2.p1 TRINITY_DN11553_c0_g1~~TRINITY_DN11553_c0_g1_i2.p1  ORF type:complete len:1249 (-),score=306.19 TRINITY_DN11553_c0_g1_i2:1169-4570(-)
MEDGGEEEVGEDEHIDVFFSWAEKLKRTKTVPDVFAFFHEYAARREQLNLDWEPKVITYIMIRMAALPTGISVGKVHRHGLHYLGQFYPIKTLNGMLPDHLRNWKGSESPEGFERSRQMIDPQVIKAMQLRERLNSAKAGAFRPLHPSSSDLVRSNVIPPEIQDCLTLTFMLDKKYPFFAEGISQFWLLFNFSGMSPDDCVRWLMSLYYMKDADSLNIVGLLDNFWTHFESNAPRFSVSEFIAIVRILDAFDYETAFKRENVLRMALFLDNFIPDISYDDLEYFIHMLKRRKLLWANFFHRVVEHYSTYSGAYPGRVLAKFVHLVATTDPDLGDTLDNLMEIVANEIILRPQNFDVSDISTVLSACSVANLYHPHLFPVFQKRAQEDFQKIADNSFYLGSRREAAGYVVNCWETEEDRMNRYFEILKQRGEPKLLVSDFEAIPWKTFLPQDFNVNSRHVGSPWRYHMDVFSHWDANLRAASEFLKSIEMSEGAPKEFVESMRAKINRVYDYVKFPNLEELTTLVTSEQEDPIDESVENVFNQFFGNLVSKHVEVDEIDPLSVENDEDFFKFSDETISKGYKYLAVPVQGRTEYYPIKSRPFAKLDRYARRPLRPTTTPLDDPLQAELFYLNLFKGLSLLANWVDHPNIREVMDLVLPFTVANLEHFKPEAVGHALLACSRHGVSGSHAVFMKGEIVLHKCLDKYEEMLVDGRSVLPEEADAILRIFRGLCAHEYNVSEETADRVMQFVSRVPVGSKNGMTDLFIALARFVAKNRSANDGSIHPASLEGLKELLLHFDVFAPETQYFWRYSNYRDLVESMLPIRDLMPGFVSKLEKHFLVYIDELLSHNRLEVGQLSGGFDLIWLLNYLSKTTHSEPRKLRWTLIDNAMRSHQRIAAVHKMTLSKLILAQENIPVNELMFVRDMLKDCAWNPTQMTDGDLKNFASMFDLYVSRTGQCPVSRQEMDKTLNHMFSREHTMSVDFLPHVLRVFAKHGVKSSVCASQVEEVLLNDAIAPDLDLPLSVSKLSTASLVDLVSVVCEEYRELVSDKLRQTLVESLRNRICNLSERELDVLGARFWVDLSDCVQSASRAVGLDGNVIDLHNACVENSLIKMPEIGRQGFEKIARLPGVQPTQ